MPVQHINFSALEDLFFLYVAIFLSLCQSTTPAKKNCYSHYIHEVYLQLDHVISITRHRLDSASTRPAVSARRELALLIEVDIV